MIQVSYVEEIWEDISRYKEIEDITLPAIITQNNSLLIRSLSAFSSLCLRSKRDLRKLKK